MANWKEGDRVRVVSRDVTEEDRKANTYFDHMAGLEGTVQNVYSATEIAVKVDLSGLGHITRDVHKIATQRMRDRFLNSISEADKKQLTDDEMSFEPHYVLLLQSKDLEKTR